ncbi:interleukin-2 receptor subunit beta [Carettochelys insculpta]|uniref:interleukin-2 receptor subunit beta n=1 Tax=Carettochelys insculpta TaxID=44489 RepID=UPI003EBDF366
MTAQLRRSSLRKGGPLPCPVGMKSSPSRLLCLWLSILLGVSLASRTMQGPSSLTCFYDLRVTVFCTWAPDRNLTEAPCQLRAISPDASNRDAARHCTLPVTQPRRCELVYNEVSDFQAFTIANSLILNVSCHIGKKWTTVMQQQKFRPMDNIQLRAPDNLRVVNTSDSSCNLTWRVPVSSHYLENKREFEVQYRDRREPWETAKLLPIKQDQEWVRIENLSPDTEYEAKVHVQPKEHGVWSNWSKTLVWRTDPSGVAPGAELWHTGLSNLTCFYDSRAMIFCTWAPDRSLTEAQCRLHAISPQTSYAPPARHCDLPVTKPRRCELVYSEETDFQAFTVAHLLSLNVSCQIGKKWTTVMQQQKFRPMDNIQLRAPDNLRVVNTSDSSCNLTWRVPVSSHYLENKREFEVQYRDRREPWETAKLLPIKQDQEWVRIENLSPDTEYEAKVHVQPKEHGVWSNWSKTLVWRTDPSGVAPGAELAYAGLPLEDLQLKMPIIVGTMCTIFLLLLLFLIINSQPRKWFKKLLRIYIPDPDKFFPPLSTVHRGDVQKWLSSPFSTSLFSVSSFSPEISQLEIIQKETQESQLLLPKAFLTPSAPAEMSGQSLSSCFTNQGYFFFHLPDACDIEPCQVYFTNESFVRKTSGSEDGDSYGALSSPDLCMMEDDLSQFSSKFLHYIEGNQGFQNSSFAGETQSTASGLGALPEALPSPESTFPALVLKQDEKVNGNATVLQLTESHQKPGLVLSALPELDDNKAIQITGESGDADPQINSTTPVADASFSFSLSIPPRQGQADLHSTASSSQVPNTEAYLSLSELQSQYNHHSG